MRSVLLFVGYLAILPFISASPGPNGPRHVDDPSPTIIKQVTLPNTVVYNYKGCRIYPTLQIPGNVPDDITLELCLASCNDGGYPWGGVRKKQCWCDTVDRGNRLDDAPCMQDTCAGNPNQYCGANAALILYSQSGTS